VIIAIEKRQSPWPWDRSKPLERILSACCAIDQESRPSIDSVLRQLRLESGPFPKHLTQNAHSSSAGSKGQAFVSLLKKYFPGRRRSPSHDYRKPQLTDINYDYVVKHGPNTDATNDKGRESTSPQSLSRVSKSTKTIVSISPLSGLGPERMPPELKKEGSDWWAIFNPSVPRVLDISLSLTLQHERHVDPIAWNHSSRLNLELHKAEFFACDSLPMGSLLLQDASVKYRFMIRRPVQERGKSFIWT